MIIKTVRNLLLEDSGVRAIFDERWYPLELPDAATFPAGVLTKASGLGEYVLAGDAGIERARVQVDLYLEGYDALLEARLLVRRRLSGFRGGAASGNPCSIDSCKCIVDEDLEVPETVRSGPRLRRRMLEFMIFNREV